MPNFCRGLRSGNPRPYSGESRSSNGSIFALVDEYEDDSGPQSPPPSPVAPPLHPLNTDIVHVVHVHDSSDDEDDHDPKGKRKKPTTPGECSAPKVKETHLKCGICWSAATDGGTHHPHVMRCGHIFGERCIRKWLKADMPSTCPICTQSDQDSLLIRLYITSARDDMLEEAITKADGVDQMKEMHRAEKASLVGLNTMLFNCIKKYVEALALASGIIPDT